MLKQLFEAAGAAAWGAAKFSGLRPYMGETQLATAEELCPGAKSVLAAAFPYFAGNMPGNLSLYCRGEDYHKVLLRRLAPVCKTLEETYPGFRFVPGADNSPLPEREAARLAGLGGIGRNGLCFVPPYGSYVFLGTILTDWAAPLSEPCSDSPCPKGCHACQTACPTGALSESGYRQALCLSEITQRKGELSPEERKVIAESPTKWGCDLCQTACPLNRNAKLSPLPEFREKLISTLTVEELEGMSNKAFRREYADRAFSWRGVGVLKRNLNYLPKNGKAY